MASVDYVGTEMKRLSHNKRMKQNGQKRIQDSAQLGGKDDPLGIVQEIKI